MKYSDSMSHLTWILIALLGVNACSSPESEQESSDSVQHQVPVISFPEQANLPGLSSGLAPQGGSTPKRAKLPKLAVLSPKEVAKLPAPSAALPDFAGIETTRARKRRFFAFMRPLIRAENARIAEQRLLLLRLYRAFKAGQALSRHDREWLKGLGERYRLTTPEVASGEAFQRLLLRVDTVPMGLALVQAANESAWGTSRFAQRGNNLYGEWCFNKGCGIIPKRRPHNSTYEVATFPSPIQSVRSYLRTLNSHPAYRRLRMLRYEKRLTGEEPSGYTLALGLKKYSGIGMEYVRTLRIMLAQNEALIEGPQAD